VPRIHEYGEEGNIHRLVRLEFGNVEEGFAEPMNSSKTHSSSRETRIFPIEQHASRH